MVHPPSKQDLRNDGCGHEKKDKSKERPSATKVAEVFLPAVQRTITGEIHSRALQHLVLLVHKPSQPFYGLTALLS